MALLANLQTLTIYNHQQQNCVLRVITPRRLLNLKIVIFVDIRVVNQIAAAKKLTLKFFTWHMMITELSGKANGSAILAQEAQKDLPLKQDFRIVLLELTMCPVLG